MSSRYSARTRPTVIITTSSPGPTELDAPRCRGEYCDLMLGAASSDWPLVGRAGTVSRCRTLLDVQRGVVLAGPAGVGKTRIAREVADLYEESTTVVRIAATTSQSIAVGAVLQSATGATRPILVLDDAHELDDDAAAVVHSLVTRQQVTLITTVRTGETAPHAITALWKDDHVERIDLADLTRNDVDQVLDLVLDGPIAAPCRRTFWESTHGSPLTLRELVRSGLNDGTLIHSEGLWQLTEQPHSTRLDEIVGARLDLLADDARGVVELVALGEPLGFVPLVAHVGIDALVAAEDSGLVEAVTDELRRDVRLAHPIYGDVTRRQLGEARSAQRCQQLLSIIETTPMRRRDDIVRSVTWQLRAGGTVVSADMVLAARRALYDNQERLAIELATRALEDDAVEAALILSGAFVDSGRPRQAERVLSNIDAADTASSDADRALVAILRARAMFWGLGDAAATETLLVAAERRLDPGPWRDEIRATRALMASNQGQVGVALELATPFLDGERSGRTFVTASIAGTCALMLVGRCNDAKELAQDAFAACSALDGELALTDPGIFIVSQAMAMSEAGELADAEGLARIAYDVSVADGLRVGQAWFSMILGRVRMMRGALSDAVELFTEAAAAFTALHHDGPRRWSLAGVVTCSAMRGDAQRAEAAWAELESVPDHPAKMMGVEVHRAEAWLCVSREERDRAADLLRATLDEAVAADSIVLASGVLHDLLRLDAPVSLDEWAPVRECQGPLVPLRLRLAEANSENDPDALESVAADFADIDADLFAAEAALMAADLFSERGDKRSATRCRRSAAAAQAATGEEWLVTLDRPTRPVEVTDRELDVATRAAQGLTNREIAENLGVSVRTIENHLQRVYEKLGVSGRRDLKSALALS